MGDIMNLVTINSTTGKHFEREFVEVAEDKNFIVIDIEAIATHIGRDIVDDNPEVTNPNDICNEEIYAWVSMFTDEIYETIKEEVVEYIDNNINN